MWIAGLSNRANKRLLIFVVKFSDFRVVDLKLMFHVRIRHVRMSGCVSVCRLANSFRMF
jgi:hypothetical protein